jgi:hypothetical protein
VAVPPEPQGWWCPHGSNPSPAMPRFFTFFTTFANVITLQVSHQPVQVCWHFHNHFSKVNHFLTDCALGPKCNASFPTPSGTRWSSCLIRAPLLIVRPSILSVITLSIVSRSPKTKWPYGYHLCLEPILFFSFSFPKSGA